MKKLLILAAVAASMAAFAKDCNFGPSSCKPEGPWAYQWKFTGKTADGVKLADVYTTGICDWKGEKTVGEIMRVPASLAIQGYTYICKPCCVTEGYAFDKEAFIATKPAKEAFGEIVNKKLTVKGGVNVRVGNIIGKKGTQFEMAGEFNATTAETKDQYNFFFAGFGKYDKKNLRVSSVSGNFAGLKVDVNSAKYEGCPEATYWDCCVTTWLDPELDSIAYGSWSVKYNASASKKYKSGIVAKLPVIGTNY